MNPMNLKVQANQARYYLERVFKMVAYFYSPTWIIQMPWESEVQYARCDDKFPADSVAHQYATVVYILRNGASYKEAILWAKDVFAHYPPKNPNKILLTPKMTELFTYLAKSKQLDDFMDEGEIHGPQTSRRTLAKEQVEKVENIANEMDYEERVQYFNDYYRVYEAIQNTVPHKGGEARYADFLLQTIHPAELNKVLREHTPQEIASELKIEDPMNLTRGGDGSQDKLATKLGRDGSKPVHLFVPASDRVSKTEKSMHGGIFWWHLRIRRK
ncbi:MAG: hypothetical protein II938_04205 [Alphaproteobacteria bacterium]|nr:hypothetical protein [Alphaproteobacteria bacterium]